MTRNVKDGSLSWKELADLLSVKSPEDEAERIWEAVALSDFGWTLEYARQGLSGEVSQEEIEAKASEIEQDCIDRECDEQSKKYEAALKYVGEKLFEEHNLCLTEVEKEGEESHFLIEPKKNSCTGWYRAAQALIETINGYGMFGFANVHEFVDHGPYESIKEAVLTHAHWIPSWAQVYEGSKASSMVDSYLRRY